MKRAISSFILRLFGWTVVVDVPDYPKCVICVAPHTSNWDFFIGKLAYLSIGRYAGFMMKKEWFFFPLGILFKAVGGIPVNRGRKSSLVEQMAEVFAKRPKFHLAITPEGTRKRNPNWKKGFYYIAQGAGLPIILVAIDYAKKCITAEKVIHPSGDLDKDMREIKLYYKNFKGKYPENFSIGKVE